MLSATKLFTALYNRPLLTTDGLLMSLNRRVPWRRTFVVASSLRPPKPSLHLGRYAIDPASSVRSLQCSKLGSPHLWYLAARSMKRKIVMHVGPTNSGKTYNALKRLRESANGVYCGPLRLLAWEVSEKLNDEGLPCTLVTGQEYDPIPGARHISSTVEMVDIDSRVEIGVLDEIQMIADESRGWAWTRVLLGLPARELHCCGDASAVSLVERIIKMTGDELIVHTYERLSPLVVATSPVASLASVSRGDCVVAFSRRELFDVTNQIERKTGLRCGVIYGALPPAIRREQARRFNDVHSNLATDVLVATDAIGMGLNLAIKRVVFSRLDKFDGQCRRNLTISEMKQIGGRAGRYNSNTGEGVVSGFPTVSLEKVRKALSSATPPVQAAGCLPTLEQLESFAASLVPDFTPDITEDSDAEADDIGHIASRASVFGEDCSSGLLQYATHTQRERQSHASIAAEEAAKRVPFSKIIETFLERITIDSTHFFLCDYTDIVRLARLLDATTMSFRSKYVFCMCPVDLDEPLCVKALQRYASKFERGKRVKVGLQLPQQPPKNPTQLRELEAAHAVFDIYLWLARRFPSVFTELDAAQRGAETTQSLIQQGLEEMSRVARMHAVRRIARTRKGHGSPRSRRKSMSVSDYWKAMQDVEDAEDDSDGDRDEFELFEEPRQHLKMRRRHR